jgi:Mrp family chromosome partitioning ATPase
MTEELKSITDLIIFDTPSLLAVVDATLLMRTCDVALVVARASGTSAETLKRAYAQLQQSGQSILGVLFNAVPKPRLRDKRYYQQLRRKLNHGSSTQGLAFVNADGSVARGSD